MFVNNLKYRMNSVIFKIYFHTVYKPVRNRVKLKKYRNRVKLKKHFLRKRSNTLLSRRNEDLHYIGRA